MSNGIVSVDENALNGLDNLIELNKAYNIK